MDSTLALREFLEYVIAQLIEQPGEAIIAHRLDDGRHVFDVELAEGDVGRVIGKNGQTVGAIRNLLEAGAWRNGERVVLNVRRKGETGEPGDREDQRHRGDRGDRGDRGVRRRRRDRRG